MKTTVENDIHRERLSNFTVNLSLFYNIFLSIIKTFFGIFGHSSSLLADGIHSTSDVVYYIVVKIFLKIANKPSDKNHPFGHKQLENVASLVVASFIITTAIAIAWNSLASVIHILHGQTQEFTINLITLYVAFFTIISKIILSLYTTQVGVKTKNPVIQALASDHLNDVYATLAVVVGIVFTVKGIVWVDPLASIVVAVFIMKTGIHILRVAAKGLMDIAPSDDMKDLVYSVVNKMTEKITVESVLSHRYGPYYSLNITLGLSGSLSMNQGDALADLFEKELMAQDTNLKYVFIHYHPVVDSRQ